MTLLSKPENNNHKLALRSWFKAATRMVILGIGHPLRGDDGVGPWITTKLEPYNTVHSMAITAYTVPENVIGPIIRLHPSHLLIIDAAIIPDTTETTNPHRTKSTYMPAGTWTLIDSAHFHEWGLSTHSGTMQMIIDRLKNKLPQLDIRFLVIQPQTTTLIDHLSKPVHQTAAWLLSFIVQLSTKQGLLAKEK